MSAGATAATVWCFLGGFWLLQEGGAQPGSQGQELLLRSASVWPSRERQESCPARCPHWEKEKWASLSIRACIAPKGERTSRFLLAPQPKAAAVLHFLCWQNYQKGGSGRPRPAGWHRSSPSPCQALLGWEPAGPQPQRQQQAGGMEHPDFQHPDFERDKSPRKKSWMAVADKDLQLSTYIWESIYCKLQAHSSSGKSNGGSF